MVDNGFRIKSVDVEDVPAARASWHAGTLRLLPHTARIGNYVIEGHVPAADIKRLLKEQPRAIVRRPGMRGLSGHGKRPEAALRRPRDRQGREAGVFAKH